MRWRVGLREALVQKQRGKVLCSLTLRQVGTDRHQQTDRLADWQELTWRISRSLPSTSAAQCSSLFRLCCLATRALDSRSRLPLPSSSTRSPVPIGFHRKASTRSLHRLLHLCTKSGRRWCQAFSRPLLFKTFPLSGAAPFMSHVTRYRQLLTSIGVPGEGGKMSCAIFGSTKSIITRLKSSQPVQVLARKMAPCTSASYCLTHDEAARPHKTNMSDIRKTRASERKWNKEMKRRKKGESEALLSMVEESDCESLSKSSIRRNRLKNTAKVEIWRAFHPTPHPLSPYLSAGFVYFPL